MTVSRYAVIPTHNRPSELLRLVTSLDGSCDTIFIVDNASSPPVADECEYWPAPLHSEVVVLRDEEQPPNLARLWNVALDRIALRELNSQAWDVAIFNDDADVPRGWYDYVSRAMRTLGTAGASGDPYGHVRTALIKTRPDNDLMTRMCPWAFVMRGELGLRADEDLRWWWQDTDMDWRLRRAGGVVIMPGYVVPNTGANSTTHGALAEQAGRDRRAFAAKWGYNPW